MPQWIVVPLAGAVVIVLWAAFYAHRHLAVVSRSEADRRVARALLIGVGLGFGLAMVGVAAEMPDDYSLVLRALILAGGFGLVHVPAALIIWLKRVHRRAGVETQQPEDWP